MTDVLIDTFSLELHCSYIYLHWLYNFCLLNIYRCTRYVCFSMRYAYRFDSILYIYMCVCVLLLTRTFLQTYILNADGQK